jgi:phosphatidylglycerol---prolipoprotein diacylglyceryl transferase
VRVAGENLPLVLEGRPARSQPVHPAQLYDTVSMLLLAAALWFYYPLRSHDGEVFALGLVGYSLSRFILEIIRVDEPSQFGTGLSISQLISIVLFAGGIALVLWIEYRRHPRALPWEAAENPTSRS